MNPFASSALSKITGNAIDLIGSAFNLPEMHISEALAGGNTLNTNKVAAPNFNEYTGYTNDSLNLPSTVPASQTNKIGTGDVLGASTGGTVSTGGTTSLGNEQALLDQIAQRNRNQQVGQLNDQLAAYEREKNSLLDRIGASYNTVRNQAKDTLTANLGALDQAKTDTTQGYSNLKTEQSRLLSDTLLRNRMIARALGNNDSGYYQNIQAKANGNTQNAISNIGQTEQSQLDQILSEMTNQQNQSRTYEGDLAAKQTQDESAANNQYQTYYGDIQRGISGADTNLANYLDNIALQIAQTKAAQAAAVNPVKDMTDKIKLMGLVNSTFSPGIDKQNTLSQAYGALNNGGNYNDIIGYLSKSDPSLALEFQSNVGKTGGVNLPIIGNIGGSYAAPTNTQTSSLDSIYKMLGLQ